MSQFQWKNEPVTWSRNNDGLSVTPDTGSDFWVRTHYGFTHDNGHLYSTAIEGDVMVEATIEAEFRAKYDQAGVMLWLDHETWLKTGVEYVDGRHYASVVVTRGFSDWSVCRQDTFTGRFRIRLARWGDAVEARFGNGDGELAMLRLGHFPAGPGIAGAMACAPIAGGFSAQFTELLVRPLGADEPFGE